MEHTHDNSTEHLHQRLARIESLCDQLLAQRPLLAISPTTAQRPITIEEVAKLTHCPVSTVRGWVAKRLLTSHRQGKRLLFFEDEVLDWVKKGRRLTGEERIAAADQEGTHGQWKAERHGNEIRDGP